MNKELRLLTAIGWVRDEYILEMQQPARARVPRRKLWLVAAVIALSLLLTGCAAVYFMRLENLTLHQEIVMDEAGEKTQVRTEISLQGVAGSPNFLAVQEWDEFCRNYDTDMAIYKTLSNEEMDQGLEYYSYRCYTREMADKVDEICEQYNLQKQGMPQHEQSWENICHVFQVEDLLRPEADLDLERYEGYIFRSGSFKLEAEAKLFPSGNQPILSVSCVAKTDFSTVAINVGDVEQYQQWNTTTPDGTKLLLALGPNGGLILADKADYFYSITVHDYNEYEGNGQKGRLEPAHIQMIADAFDFSLPIHPLSDGEWEYLENNKKELVASEVEAAYAEWVRKMLDAFPRAKDWGYTILDTDGDGTQELVIGKDGMVRNICTASSNGKVNFGPFSYIVFDNMKANVFGDPAGTPVAPSYGYLCEGNKMLYVYERTDDTILYQITGHLDGEHWGEIQLVEDLTTNSYFRYPGGETRYQDYPITKAEFDKILNACVPIELEMHPLTQFPLD